MAWTSPMTFVANNVLTASQLNTFLSGNLLETAPAKATTAGSWFVGAGENKIVERIPAFAKVAASESTSSTSFIDLETVGPSVTTYTGSRVIIFISGSMTNSFDAATSIIGYEITGSETQAATDTSSLTIDGVETDKKSQRCQIILEENIKPGLNTFKLKYKVGSNTGNFSDRFIGVWPL